MLRRKSEKAENDEIRLEKVFGGNTRTVGLVLGSFGHGAASSVAAISKLAIEARRTLIGLSRRRERERCNFRRTGTYHIRMCSDVGVHGTIGREGQQESTLHITQEQNEIQ